MGIPAQIRDHLSSAVRKPPKSNRELKQMGTNYYLEKLYQDMRLRSCSEHTQDVYGRAVRNLLNFSGKPAEALNEADVRNYTLHLMSSKLSKGQHQHLSGSYSILLLE